MDALTCGARARAGALVVTLLGCTSFETFPLEQPPPSMTAGEVTTERPPSSEAPVPAPVTSPPLSPPPQAPAATTPPAITPPGMTPPAMAPPVGPPLSTTVDLEGAAVQAIWAAGDGDGVERDAAAPSAGAAGGPSLWDGQRVKLFGGRNEVLAFQVIVKAREAGVRALSARLPELRHAGGAALPYAPPG